MSRKLSSEFVRFNKLEGAVFRPRCDSNPRVKGAAPHCIISASGSQDLVDLHGVGGRVDTIRDQSKPVVASATTQFQYGKTQVLAQGAADVKNHLLASLC